MGFLDKIAGNLFGAEKNNSNKAKLKSYLDYISSIASFLYNEIESEGIESLENSVLSVVILNSTYCITMSNSNSQSRYLNVVGYVTLYDLVEFRDFVKSFPTLLEVPNQQKAKELHLLMVKMYLDANLSKLSMSIFNALCQKVPELHSAQKR
jgi:hypothetical protein